MRPSRLSRVARGGVAASVATWAALLSHVAAGGAMPGWLGVAVPLVLSVAVCTALAGRHLSLVRLAVAVTASQLLFHMGTIFGLANQIVMLLLAVGIAGMVVLGYVMWVKRRPTKTARVGMPPRRGVLDGAPWWGVTAVVVGGVLVGLALPLVGWTLAAFVVVDVAVDAVQRRRAAAA